MPEPETVEPATDAFPAMARTFVNAWDRLSLVSRKSFSDFPSPAEVSPVCDVADVLYLQNGNIFRDFTIPDQVAVDLAGSFLSWMADPGNPARWETQFRLRWQLHDDDSYPWEIPDERK